MAAYAPAPSPVNPQETPPGTPPGPEIPDMGLPMVNDFINIPEDIFNSCLQELDTPFSTSKRPSADELFSPSGKRRSSDGGKQPAAVERRRNANGPLSPLALAKKAKEALEAVRARTKEMEEMVDTCRDVIETLDSTHV